MESANKPLHWIGHKTGRPVNRTRWQKVEHMNKREIKGWLLANWLSIIIGLVLPLVLGWLWVLFRSPLQSLSQYVLSSFVLILGIVCCILMGLSIYLVKRLLRVTRYVNETFYPNETTHGTFRNVKEQMEHDAEYSKGWEDAMKE